MVYEKLHAALKYYTTEQLEHHIANYSKEEKKKISKELDKRHKD